MITSFPYLKIWILTNFLKSFWCLFVILTCLLFHSYHLNLLGNGWPFLESWLNLRSSLVLFLYMFLNLFLSSNFFQCSRPSLLTWTPTNFMQPQVCLHIGPAWISVKDLPREKWKFPCLSLTVFPLNFNNFSIISNYKILTGK